MTVPNEKIIKCGAEGKAPCDEFNIYAKINKEAMFDAIDDLTPTTFQVWLYLASQTKNYTFAFSPVAVSQETHITKRSLQEGIRVLIEKKYLIQREDGSNIYDFYEHPQKEEDIKLICCN